MLGLANSLAGGAAPKEFTPESISNIALWLKVNTNITADENSGGSGLDPENTSNGGNMDDGDRINAWNAAGSTSINAVQTTTGDKPRWETDAADLGGVKSAGGNKYMNLSADITFDADTDFTIVMRFRPIDFGGVRALVGKDDAEFIRLQDADTIRVKTDSTTSDFDSGTALETDKYITVIVVRSDGSTGNINVFVRGEDSGYFDGTAAGTAFGDEVQDTEEIVVSNLMSQADDSADFKGIVKDVIIYDGTAVTSGQREKLFDYIEGQDY